MYKYVCGIVVLVSKVDHLYIPVKSINCLVNKFIRSVVLITYPFQNQSVSMVNFEKQTTALTMENIKAVVGMSGRLQILNFPP